MSGSIYTGPAATIVAIAPNPNLFFTPMSKNARELTQKLFDKLASLIRPGINHGSLMTALTPRWDPIIFENAVAKYKNLATKISTGLDFHKKLNLNQIIDRFLLTDIDDDWAETHGLDLNGKCVGFLTDPKVISTYRYLTKNFLLSDFNESELNKLIAMGQFELSAITEVCNTIPDPNKHNASYLWAAMTELQQRNDSSKRKSDLAKKSSDAKLLALIDTISGEKQAYKSDADRLEQWNIDRVFIDDI